MAAKRSGFALIAVLAGVAVVIGMLAGGARGLPPLQSPVETPTSATESTLVPTVAPPTPTLVPTVAPPTPTWVPTVAPPASLPTPTFGPTPTPGPSPTPDVRATSESVIATITAQAIPPTYPPTSVSRPRRTPIGAGPATAPPRPTSLGNANVAVLALSQQVPAGGAAALTVKTRPGARCTVSAARDGDAAAAGQPIHGVAARVAGANGVAAWIWTIDSKEPAAIMRLLVDCGSAGTAEVLMRIAN
jgi:hypothetical protein